MGRGILQAWTGAMALACSSMAAGADTYRVEVLVFRHLHSEAEPAEVASVRGFHDVLDPGEPALPEAPEANEAASETFQALWRRLQRLGAYEPLALLDYEQTQVDYHPPVRLHDDVAIAEELHFPGPMVYVDLDAENLFAEYIRPMYRLDGTVQLRRSRFLHLHFDLEYRMDDPRWEMWGLSPEVTAEDIQTQSASDTTGETVHDVMDKTTNVEPAPVPQPFLAHRLQQSRQVRTDALHYFDTPFLGAIARVTAIEEDTQQ